VSDEQPTGGGRLSLGPAIGDPRELRLYRHLLQQPGVMAAELAAVVAEPGTEVEAALRRLRDRGLATERGEDDGGGWEAREPPDEMGEHLTRAAQYLAGLRDYHDVVRRLNELYWSQRASDRYDGIEVIYDQLVVHDTLQKLQTNARREIRAFDRPPYYSLDRPERRAEQQQTQARRMAHGLKYRVIYEDSVWNLAPIAQDALHTIANGEDARASSRLPMKLWLSDDDRAVVPLDPAHHKDSATLLIYPSGLLRALSEIFETYWQTATPIGSRAGAGDGEPGERDRSILTLLSAGANDEMIARRLSLSRSTVTRAVAQLQVELGAQTRFQCGAQAVRRGWI
jgi:predicted transcriptional regulator